MFYFFFIVQFNIYFFHLGTTPISGFCESLPLFNAVFISKIENIKRRLILGFFFLFLSLESYFQLYFTFYHNI